MNLIHRPRFIALFASSAGALPALAHAHSTSSEHAHFSLLEALAHIFQEPDHLALLAVVAFVAVIIWRQARQGSK